MEKGRTIIPFRVGVSFVAALWYATWDNVQPEPVQEPVKAKVEAVPKCRIEINNNGKYQWVDDDGYISMFEYDTKEEAIAATDAMFKWREDQKESCKNEG